MVQGSGQHYWLENTAILSRLSEFRAAEIVRGVIQADDDSLRIKGRIVQEVPELFERVISYLVENLKGVESIKEQWINSDGFRASVAMLGAATNYLLAVRQLLGRGYAVESEILLREVEDRAARAYLFRADETAAARFLSGKILRPTDVRRKLDKLFVRDEIPEGKPFLERLKERYAARSQKGHANLDSFWFRTPGDHEGRAPDENPVPALSAIVGTDVSLGGFRGSFMQAILIMRAIDPALFVSRCFLSLATDEDGAWMAGFDELSSEFFRLDEQIKESRDSWA